MDALIEAPAGTLRLFLNGPFRLCHSDGAEIVIRAAKARGLLALLALSPNGCRSRTWLQDKLWSDRGRAQALASLRQALSQLRDELGPLAGILSTTREMVTLDLRRVTLGESPGEFLEGLDLRDPEFEAWLRVERLARQPAIGPEQGAPAPTLPAPRLSRPRLTHSVHILPQSAAQASERLFEDIFADCLEVSLRESLTVDVYRRSPPQPDPDPMILAVQAFRHGPQAHGLRVHLEQGRQRRALWTGMRLVPAAGAPPIDHQEILSLAFEATEALGDALLLDRLRSRAELDAAMMARLAIRKIFLMSPAETISADQLLAEAFQIDPHPQFLAWRIQLRVIQALERHVQLGTTEATEIGALIAQSLAMDPHNSMVLAATANARMLLEGNALAGAELARASLRINAANPFAWDCLSIAHLMTGAAEEAHRHQMRANVIAARFPIRHFWDMGGCLTAVETGRLDQALQMARSAHALAPGFRPPLRYLTALHAMRGEVESALDHARRLRQLEPDFSLDRLISDKSYPAAALRRSGLLAGPVLRDLRNHRL